MNPLQLQAVAHLYHEIERSMSIDRLARYRPNNEPDLIVAATSFWNIQLCEALYPSLHTLEIVLRNALHDTLATRFGRQDWYNRRHLLQPNERDAISSAISKIRRARKQVNPGRVVSTVTFGFWTSILQSSYGEKPGPSQIWGTPSNSLLPTAFPNAPSAVRTNRKAIQDQIDEIRRLRNRAYHCECIFDDTSLRQKHQSTLDVISWINPTIASTIHSFDRFESVFSAGIPGAEASLRSSLNIP